MSDDKNFVEFEPLGDEESEEREAFLEETDEDSDDEDGIQWDDDTRQNYWEEYGSESVDRGGQSKGLLIVGGVLIVVLGLIICGILWKLSQVQNTGNTTPQTQTTVLPSPEIEPEEPTESAEEPTAEAEPTTTPYVAEEIREPISGDLTMTFTEVSETVTAVDITNLRSVPDVVDPENVLDQLENGTTLLRTGVNEETGWSRLEYDGEIVFAVTQFLTTDLDHVPQIEEEDPNRVTSLDGRVTIFQEVDEYVTPKETVNLRVEPSTSQGRRTVSQQLKLGMVAHRIGYSVDSGWSRIEVGEMVLYVVSDYLELTEESTATPATPTPTVSSAPTESTPEPQTPVVESTPEPQPPVVESTPEPQPPVVESTPEPQPPVVESTPEPQAPSVESTPQATAEAPAATQPPTEDPPAE